MTVGDWLAQREPPPPVALINRLRELLDGQLGAPAAMVPELFVGVGERRLSELLTEGATDRASALDLLAVDALLTYAFEAAADTPDALESLASASMRRIAEIPEAS